MKQRKTTAGAVFGAFGKAACYLILFLLCQTGVSLLYSLIISLFYVLNPASSVDYLDLIYACTDQISLLSNLLALVFLAAFFLLRRKNPLRETGFRATQGRRVFTAVAVTPLLYTLVTVVLGMLPEQWLEDYAEASAVLNETGLIMTIATVLVGPIVEEIIFRGLLISRLNRALPGWLSVLISALVFGLCHGQIVWMAYAFVLGVIFGFMYLRARSVWPSLVAHILFNGIGQLLVVLSEAGVNEDRLFLALIAVGVGLCILVGLFRLLWPLKKRHAKLPAGAT